MKSQPQPEQVLADLGDKVIDPISESVAETRDDLQEYRRDKPLWVASQTERGLAGWIHDRVWEHLVGKLDALAGVSIVDREPVREFYVSTNYRLRFKRHRASGRVSTYPTQTALDFFGPQPSLPGLQEIRLAAGYLWDRTTRSIGPAVISLRSQVDRVVWMAELAPPPAGTASNVADMPTPTDTGPTTPVIDVDTKEGDETGEAASP